MANKRDKDTILIYLCAYTVTAELMREHFAIDRPERLTKIKTRFDIAHAIDYIYALRKRTDALPYVTLDELEAFIGWKRRSIIEAVYHLRKLGMVDSLAVGRFRQARYIPTQKLLNALRHIRKAIAVEQATRHKRALKARK